MDIVKFEDGQLIYDGEQFSSLVNNIIDNIDSINALWWLRSEMNITLDARFAERTDRIIYDSACTHNNNNDEIEQIDE